MSEETSEAAESAEAGGVHAQPPDRTQGRYLAMLSLAALGVVYGDIGTSPLYAIRESFHAEYGLPVVPENILGVLSSIFWSLILVISVKYLVFIMRADNRGEGGILALTALVTPMRAGHRGGKRPLILMGLFGAALLYGDGMITPAISVLSAVEGLEIATPFFQPYIIPITIGILVGLFFFQKRGTEGVGRIFGPVTLVWFFTLAALGTYQIAQEPGVLRAVNPLDAVHFFRDNGLRGFLVLGSVFLVVTGGEALYADMGHFGRRPIRLAWFTLVLPSLLLNYFGQGALLIRRPEAIENPFYRMGPEWALYPMVVLATVATVIASQAVISGSFSLAMQSVQLGYSPRLDIEHTSAREMGQIYIPAINWGLMIACIALVVGFGSSSALAAAYGVAVTTTMVITTILFYVLAREKWGWPLPIAVLVSLFFLSFDMAFWGANLVKIPDGGWFPLLIAAGVFTVMTTWKTGRGILYERMQARSMSTADFLPMLESDHIVRVPGTAVYMYSGTGSVPPALLHNLKHNRALHEHLAFLTVDTEEVPHVPKDERLTVECIGGGIHQVILRYGFMEDPNVPRDLELARKHGLVFKPMETSYFLGRENLLVTNRPGMVQWRERLFAMMSRNARSATDYFHLPPNRVVELGAQVEI